MTQHMLGALLGLLPFAVVLAIVVIDRLHALHVYRLARRDEARVRARVETTRLEIEAGVARPPTRSTDRRCHDCGATTTDEGAFCDTCGAKRVDITRRSDALACRECGEVNALMASYCHMCGRSLYYYTREDRLTVL